MRYKKLHFFHKKVGKKIWSIQKNVVSLYCENKQYCKQLKNKEL